MSACKQIKMIRTPPRSSENLAPINYNIHEGLLHAPPPSLSFSYSSSSSPSLFNHYRYQQLQQAQRQQQQHPPLLPLPVPNYRHHHHHQSLPSRTRGLSSRPPTTRKANNARSQSLTPKKPKSKPSSKKEEVKQDFNTLSECLIIASTNRLGPDPTDLPKDVTRVLSSSSSIGKSTLGGGVSMGDMGKFSGSIFTLSPPPSSLPLPRFAAKARLQR